MDKEVRVLIHTHPTVAISDLSSLEPSTSRNKASIFHDWIMISLFSRAPQSFYTSLFPFSWSAFSFMGLTYRWFLDPVFFHFQRGWPVDEKILISTVHALPIIHSQVKWKQTLIAIYFYINHLLLHKTCDIWPMNCMSHKRTSTTIGGGIARSICLKGNL